MTTWLGRASPPPTGTWVERAPDQGLTVAEDRDRRAWGRFTRNFVVQGSGAEWALCWMALLRDLLWRLPGTGPLTDRPHLVLFLHDEVVVHTPAALTDAVVDATRDAAARATRLLFGDAPLDVPLDVTTGSAWAEARPLHP